MTIRLAVEYAKAAFAVDTTIDMLDYQSYRRLEQICKRLDRRAASEAAPDKADSQPASLTYLRFALTLASVVVLRALDG